MVHTRAHATAVAHTVTIAVETHIGPRAKKILFCRKCPASIEIIKPTNSISNPGDIRSAVTAPTVKGSYDSFLSDF
jgi:hypothetical protein